MAARTALLSSYFSFIGKPLVLAGLLRLTRFVNVTASTFILFLVFAHTTRIFMFARHSGIYLLP